MQIDQIISSFFPLPSLISWCMKGSYWENSNQPAQFVLGKRAQGLPEAKEKQGETLKDNASLPILLMPDTFAQCMPRAKQMSAEATQTVRLCLGFNPES